MKGRHRLPAEVYALVDATPASVLLEGNNRNTSEEPWTQLFLAPLRICAAHDASQIPALFAGIERAAQAGLWAAGFFSYECAESFEPKARVREPDMREPGITESRGSPLAWFGIYDRSYAFDHRTGRFAEGEPAELEALRARAVDESASLPTGLIEAEFALTGPEYAQRIEAIHEWIRAGDVYQLNFTAPLRVTAHGGAAALYARLRQRQPAQYGAFLHLNEGRRILSFSPELFFRVDAGEGNRRITARPMKGTAARGRTTGEDRERAGWLRNDAKNRSENVMIVDLLRNDLGRLAKFGTVRTEELFAVERYPTLWQMTSTVTAELRDGVDFEQIFRALFPCGSITGAPKVRAMQLIAELEDGPRGVYTGAIGFFSPRQTVFNVAIRTLQLDGVQGTMGVGSGIVIDSAPESEFRECLLKAEFLTAPAEKFPAEFSLIETMRWEGRYPLMELHLDRLADSALYFDFQCEPEKIRAALEEHARGFDDNTPRRVRMLLDRDGGAAITHELLGAERDSTHVGRVRVAEARTDPADRMLFHKTTHRPLYAEAFQAAARDGFDDVLFLNLRGEVTEGAISNVFVEMGGKWFTPPVECGLLAGVCRRHLLETRQQIEEKVLYLDDLLRADAIYLANALRGLRRVRLEMAQSALG
jgi:para-aminobenzoate synthetase/4-amino-4-deoxychorismate lyase